MILQYKLQKATEKNIESFYMQNFLQIKCLCGLRFSIFLERAMNCMFLTALSWLNYFLENGCKCWTSSKHSKYSDAVCGKYSNSDFLWCYLEAGLKAEACPGAVRSTQSELYWSKSEIICKSELFNRLRSISITAKTK